VGTSVLGDVTCANTLLTTTALILLTLPVGGGRHHASDALSSSGPPRTPDGLWVDDCAEEVRSADAIERGLGGVTVALERVPLAVLDARDDCGRALGEAWRKHALDLRASQHQYEKSTRAALAKSRGRGPSSLR